MRRTITILAATAAVITAVSSRGAADSPTATARTKPDQFEWLTVTGGLGYQRVSLRTFLAESGENTGLTADLIPSELAGPAPTLGVGVKLWFVTLGVTGKVARLTGGSTRPGDALQLWSVDGEFRFHAPLGRVEPFVLLGGGYSTFGDMDDAIGGIQHGLDIDGVNVRAGAGLDLYLTPTLSARVYGTGELLFLARAGVPARDLAEPKEVGTINETQARILEADGASAGAGIELGAAIGVHF